MDNHISSLLVRVAEVAQIDPAHAPLIPETVRQFAETAGLSETQMAEALVINDALRRYFASTVQRAYVIAKSTGVL